MPAKIEVNEALIMSEFIKYLKIERTIPKARDKIHVSYKVLARLKRENKPFNDEIYSIIAGYKKNYDGEFIVCKICGSKFYWQDYKKHRMKNSNNHFSISTFRERKSCSNPECITKSRKRHGGHGGNFLNKGTWGEPLSWTNYFDGELHYIYEDRDGDKSTAGLIKLFSLDTELPVSYLIKMRIGEVMINEQIARLIRKCGICYSTQSIMSLQHKLCEKQEVNV